MPQDTHIPEYAVASVPAHAPRQAAAAPLLPVEQEPLSGRAHCVCSIARNGSMPSLRSPMDHPCNFPGVISRTKSHASKAPSASPWNGGATTAATSSRAIIFVSKPKKAHECGSSAKVSRSRGQTSASSAVVPARLVCVSINHVCVCRVGRHDEFLVFTWSFDG